MTLLSTPRHAQAQFYQYIYYKKEFSPSVETGVVWTLADTTIAPGGLAGDPASIGDGDNTRYPP